MAEALSACGKGADTGVGFWNTSRVVVRPRGDGEEPEDETRLLRRGGFQEQNQKRVNDEPAENQLPTGNG